ncbi:MAG: helix-turn-helix domain-containing protein [Oscillospiraceae bacterium]|nr:helix-turn-helix domain-containing protein [Oscillospiraceae bacterium]
MLQLRLLELRKRQGITQAEIAELLNITPQAYSLYENSKNNINNETLCFLADYYNVTTDYLLGRQEALPSFLSEEERGLVERYRALDTRGKQSVQNNMSFELLQNKSDNTKNLQYNVPS